MSTLIHDIAKGKRKALTQSYEDNKERVFYIASKIAKADATRATIWAFKNAWNDLSSTSNIKENDFTCIIVRKLANYLQRNSAKSNKREIMSTCEKLSADYSATNNAISVPSELTEKMYEAIDRISKPIEEQNKKIEAHFAAKSKQKRSFTTHGYLLNRKIGLVKRASPHTVAIFLRGSRQ